MTTASHFEHPLHVQFERKASMSTAPASPPSRDKTMKAVIWEGHVNHMIVKEIPQPTIEHPSDIIVRVTTAGICGTDLHIYHGLIGATNPRWNVGHEAVGIVVEVGSEVELLKPGQRVLIPDGIPFDPAASGAPGFYGLGTLSGAEYLGGCQAEYVRLPLADQYAKVLPDGFGNDDDFIMLSDIFPTAWEAVTKSGFQAGDNVAVFGCGPVGLLGQYSAFLRGANKVYAIDHVDSRLAKAKSIGSIPIDLKKGDPADQILALEKNGVQRSLDLCGYECVNAKLEPEEGYIINQAVKVTATSGGIGVIGVYIGTEPSAGSPEQNPARGFINFDVGTWWAKGITIGGGVVYTQDITPQLLQLVLSGRAKPGFIVDRVIRIDDAPEGYRDFSDHKYGKTLIRFFP